MGVYKLSSAGGITTPRTNYSSFLAGNPAFVLTVSVDYLVVAVPNKLPVKLDPLIEPTTVRLPVTATDPVIV